MIFESRIEPPNESVFSSANWNSHIFHKKKKKIMMQSYFFSFQNNIYKIKTNVD